MFFGVHGDLDERMACQAHQRRIVRHFSPHLSNDALTRQERNYLAITLTRAIGAYLVPVGAVFMLHSWIIKTPVFVVATVVALYEISIALHRFFILWPEGLRLRWSYWNEIERSEDCYKLKILGYYHRKIEKFLGRFPRSVTKEDILLYYRRRSAFLMVLFVLAYCTFLTFLVLSTRDANARVCILYLLTVSSGLVVMRYVKMHLIELPQVLALREVPEFAADYFAPPETIPFARPVATYKAVPQQASRGEERRGPATSTDDVV